MNPGVSPGHLHRAKQVVRGVQEHGPVREDKLAALLGCDLAELRAAIGIAIRWRRIDRCAGYLVPTVSREGEASGVSGQEKLHAALAYAAARWPAFPKRPDDPSCPGGKDCECKAPFPGTRGCLDASTDPDVIRAWWRRWPTANVSIATGFPGPDVLDVDVKPDGDGWAAFNRLKRAGLLNGAKALVRTLGGGLHSYYAGSGQRNGKLPRHHIDFRSAGGYVLAPPSRVHGRPYELLDHRARACGHLDWQAATRLLEPPRPAGRPRGSGAGDLGKLAAWVAAQREGNRNDGLFWAACRAAETGHGDLDDLVAAAVTARLAEAEARRTVASAARKVAVS